MAPRTRDQVLTTALERIAHAPLGIDPGELRKLAREALDRAARVGVGPVEDDDR